MMYTPVTNEDSSLLPIYIYGSKEISHQDLAYYNTGTVGFFQMELFYHGSGIFIDHNGQKHTIEQGDIIYFRDSLPVKYYPSSEQWPAVYILFYGEALPELWEQLRFLHSGVIRCSDTAPYHKASSLFKKIIDLNVNPSKQSHIKCSYTLYELLILLSECIHLAKHKSGKNTENLTPVVNVMKGRYNEDISLNYLAEIAGYNPTYLGKLFKEVYGMSPIKYLNLIRIQKAKELLSQNNGLTIKEISFKCGFTDNAYFSRIFKEYTGMTAKAFRDMSIY